LTDLGVTLYADPGETTGAALAHNGVLCWCGVLSLTDHWLPVLRFPFTQQTDRLVIEIPNAHESKGATRSRRDPQAIVMLAITCGQWIRHVSAKHTIRKFPSTWKGGVPKKIHNDRVLACLDERELTLVQIALGAIPASKRNNVIDAVGLFLEDTERMTRGRATT
jgi:hypothetical protein